MGGTRQRCDKYPSYYLYKLVVLATLTVMLVTHTSYVNSYTSYCTLVLVSDTGYFDSYAILLRPDLICVITGLGRGSGRDAVAGVQPGR